MGSIYFYTCSDLCTKLSLAIEQPDFITCMRFFEGSKEIANMLAVGSKLGNVVILNPNSKADKQIAVSLGHRSVFTHTPRLYTSHNDNYQH